MRCFYCIWALIALYGSYAHAEYSRASDALQAPAAESRGYTVFVRGAPVGREDVTVKASADGFIIASHGRLSGPLDLITRQAEVRYGTDWTAQSLLVEATIKGRDVKIATRFDNGSAVSDVNEGGTPTTKTDKVSPQTIVLPNFFFGAYAALTQQLRTVTEGAELRAYIAPQAEIPVRVKSIGTDRIQTGSITFSVRRYELGFVNPGGELAVQLSADEEGRFIRLTLPAQSLDVVRDDVAASTARTNVYSNPTDEPVNMPGTGFNIAGTVTRPKIQAARLPAVILLAGSSTGDRDGTAAGIPVIGQLAGALADQGFVAVRFDKRGYGQTGGRAESATLTDFAEDARTVVKYLSDRKDIDPRRIAVVGHSEGAMVALLAASRDKRIAAVVSIAGPSTTGAELVLEQQQHVLETMKMSDAERQAKIELQKKIQAAVMSGKGWEDIPPDLRKQADTPWFQSLLTFDPARVIEDVRQPLLIVHGELDRQVPVAHAERLAQLAQQKARSRAVELVTVRGVNHLLVRATTGEVGEYESLPDRNLSPDVAKAIGDWLTKTMRSQP
jgi:uncharacterized protein